MPSIKKRFLENKNLYSSEDCELPDSSLDLKGENINLYCKTCQSIQTFILDEPFFEGKNLYKLPRYKSVISEVASIKENIRGVLLLNYKCAGCEQERAVFLIKIGDNKCEKIGQYPPIDISVPIEIEKLKDRSIEVLYKKGKICESQSYGIGAFAYYRRIVELKIEELLEKIKELFPEPKKREYIKLIERVKKEKNADKKIEIVKDVISDEIISNNPLKSLYKILSEGVHNLSDEKCLEYASSIRELLILLIKEIENKKENRKKLLAAQKVIEKQCSQK